MPSKKKPFSLPLVVTKGGPFRKRTKLGTFRPGVNVLRARNGYGKTYILRLLVVFAKRLLRIGDFEVNDQLTGSTAKAELGVARMTVTVGARPARTGVDQLPPIEGLPDLIRFSVTTSRSPHTVHSISRALPLRFTTRPPISFGRLQLSGTSAEYRSRLPRRSPRVSCPRSRPSESTPTWSTKGSTS